MRCSRSIPPVGRRLSRSTAARWLSMLAGLTAVVALPWAGRFDVAFAQSSPTLRTDAPTYAAGDEVNISGHGFAPNETVTVAVTHEDGTAEPGMGHESTVGTADESGLLWATWAINAGDT